MFHMDRQHWNLLLPLSTSHKNLFFVPRDYHSSNKELYEHFGFIWHINSRNEFKPEPMFPNSFQIYDICLPSNSPTKRQQQPENGSAHASRFTDSVRNRRRWREGEFGAQENELADTCGNDYGLCSLFFVHVPRTHSKVSSICHVSIHTYTHTHGD